MGKRLQSLGRWGEEQAARFLNEGGYEILERNIYTKYGEIDLLARKDGCLIFVEVKTRSTETFGMPEQSVTKRKQAHMRAAAQAYLQAHPEIEGPWRIDVIAVRQFADSTLEVFHFENAIT